MSVRKIFLWGILIALGLSLTLPPRESFAAEKSVRVTLPEFVIKLNGNQVENQYREYPLLTYKDITYFPMTWHDSRLLGLETEWSPNDGLKIAKGKVTSSYVPYKTNIKNSGSYKATIPAIDLTINGKKINNLTEEYPLLGFRDIIYFPLTWRFAHDEFGWYYAWDDSEGLSIDSDNPHVNKVDLPADAGDNGVALFKDYYYFTETAGNTNNVYRTPARNRSDKELVYSYEVDTTYGFNKYLKFEIRDNELWFIYHVGGNIMGSDIYAKVADDGKAAVKYTGHFDFKNTPAGTLLINQSFHGVKNNLSLVQPGQESHNGKNIGDPNLLYGIHISIAGSGTGYSRDSSTTIIGDDAFVLATLADAEKGYKELNRVYKINLTTNETEKIVDTEVRNFKIRNGKLYYVKDIDRSLYSANLDGSNEQKCSEYEVADWYDEIDGQVFYTVPGSNGRFYLYKAEPAKEDALVLTEPLEKVETADGNFVCKLAAGGDYGIKVLDKSGSLRLAITDQASNVFVNHDFILFVSAEDKSIKRVHLEY